MIKILIICKIYTFQIWFFVTFDCFLLRKGTSGTVARRPAATGGGGMWKFYTEDSPGLKV